MDAPLHLQSNDSLIIDHYRSTILPSGLVFDDNYEVRIGSELMASDWLCSMLTVSSFLSIPLRASQSTLVLMESGLEISPLSLPVSPYYLIDPIINSITSPLQYNY